ncbi:hypothetical protein L1049_006130 [Liquidambar formosana]|uniref:Uncharacterized protein n=1 Tax=Liquidambar formosana TaxID=63359 RepID=A0AAP0WTS9_LIQFO
MLGSDNKKHSSSSWLFCCTSSWLPSSPSMMRSGKEPEEKHGVTLTDSKETQRKPAGWKAMPYILGNETFERLATVGLLANLMVYLLTQLHLEQVSAINILNIWSGTTNFTPMIGAFISDAYVGRFRTIAFASIVALLGMVTMTLTTWIPQLHPPQCTPEQKQLDQCIRATKTQLGVFLMGLGLLSIGTSGIRPCSIPFGVDQFDPTTEEGRKGINSFYNWYYTSFTVVILIVLTLLVYLQDSVSWAWGFGVPTLLMFCSIIFFLVGTHIYVYVKPDGSAFSSIGQVLVAAYKKRRLKLPANGEVEALEGVFYDPPLKKTVVSKLPLTEQFRLLNKASIIVDGEVNPDGSPSKKWRLCSIQQVEELKCMLKVVPILASAIIFFTALIQGGTFKVSQALQMDRHLGPKFQIPPGSLSVISMLTLALWVPFYDRVLVPSLRKITKHEGGITILQRMGIGIVFSILSMVVAGLVERERRASAILHASPDGVAPMSVMWLAPQLILLGFADAFHSIGQIEFFNKEFPEHMRSLGNSLQFCTVALASYLSSLLVTIVHDITGKHGRTDWFTDDINAGRVDYFYYLLAGMGILNLVYFVVCAHRYRYKISVQNEEKSHFDVELNPVKGENNSEQEEEEKHGVVLAHSKETQRKPGGWKAMPYILGNETFERLATVGLQANLMVYLLTQLHLNQVLANNVMNIWSGATNFAPLVGAFISDAYVGRFRTIAFASIVAFLGMVIVTLTAWIPHLHPPSCTQQQQDLHQCIRATTPQLSIFLLGLGLLSVGTSGIRPCSIPFGVDQFDPTTEEGRKGINSFFNWYYTSFTVVIMIVLTVVVYIQDSVSWAWGFGIPTLLMFCSIILFFIGTNSYVHVKPEGSVFSSIAQVLVAAYKKRGIKVPGSGEVKGVFYDPTFKTSVVSRLPLTDQFRLLNKAAVILEGEVKPDGSPSSKWRLCSIQQVEEVKCIAKVVPIWASGIIFFTALIQQGTFTVSQALKMDRHLGPKFQIPAGSIFIISMLTLALWVPFYDRILVPSLRKITNHEGGITLLQRMGIGVVFSILSMVVAGLVERDRRASANLHAGPDGHGVAPMSVLWLAPQLILFGFADAFNIIGQIEFYNKEFPDHMRSIGNSLLFCTVALGSYLSSFLVTIVHEITGKHGRTEWFRDDINAGRVDYFYYLIAGMGVLNLVYFLVCARRYRYKSRPSSSWPFCCTKCLPITSSRSPSSPSVVKEPEEKHLVLSDSKETQRKPGGWKSMPYILGRNETFERLATFGLLANFMVYLLTQLHMDQVSATNLLNIWGGITNFAPLVGAFISDAYAGRFRTIAFASIASLLGMVTLTLTAWIPQLHPPPCTPQHQLLGQCNGPNKAQLGVFVMGLGFLSIGTGGIRPCSIPFGVDQFDPATEEGRKGINSFFNWYYTSFTVVLMIALTLVVYIQDSVSWVLGFGIPTGLMFCSIILFFFGARIYVHAKPEGSVFSGIARVLVAAYRKRHLKLPATGEAVFYDPPMKGTVKLPLTKQFRFLNKAAVVLDGEIRPDGSPSNKWRLCSIQQMEEVKCLIKVVPIWASAGASYLSSVTVTIVHAVTGKRGRPSWLANNINAGRVDYFYYLIAAMGVLNLVYFVVCAQRYHYKIKYVNALNPPHVLLYYPNPRPRGMTSSAHQLWISTPK